MNQAERQTCDNDELSADQVRAYLSNHNNFFAENQELLDVLKIPHSSGSAVSLVEKQLSLLREKNEKLLAQLNVLVQIARQNDDLFQKMHKLTMALLEASNLDDALVSIESVLHEYFKADFVSIRIFHPQNSSVHSRVFVSSEDERVQLFNKIFESGRPKCGSLVPEHAEFLYGDNADRVNSAAIIPIVSDNLKALIAIGSLEEQRFLPTMGHLFLTQMGELIGIRFNTFFNAPE